MLSHRKLSWERWHCSASYSTLSWRSVFINVSYTVFSQSVSIMSDKTNTNQPVSAFYRPCMLCKPLINFDVGSARSLSSLSNDSLFFLSAVEADGDGLGVILQWPAVSSLLWCVCPSLTSSYHLPPASLCCKSLCISISFILLIKPGFCPISVAQVWFSYTNIYR